MVDFSAPFAFSGRKWGVHCEFPWAEGCTNIESLCKYHHLRNWRIRLLCVCFFLFPQNLPLSAEEQTAAQQLNLKIGKEMEFSVQEVIGAWNVSIPETFNPKCSSAECRRGWFCDFIPLKWMEFFRNGSKFLNKPFHFYSLQIKLF